MAFLFNWIDLIWIPVAFVVVHPKNRLIAICFMILCSITLRLEIDLIRSTGHHNGFIPFLWSGDVQFRATFIYSIVSALYLLLLHSSPRSPRVIVLSAGIVLYIAAFCVSMFLMAI